MTLLTAGWGDMLRRRGLLVHLFAAILGSALGLQFRTTLVGDHAAPVEWVVLSLLVSLGFFARTGGFVPLLAMLVISTVTQLSVYALGSSWAAITWFPIIIAVVALSRLSPAFVVAATSVALVRDASTLTVLYHGFSARAQSGSLQYFLGFAGAVSVFFWFRLALAEHRSKLGSVAVAVAVLMSALSLWTVLASGSRAALLALALGTIAAASYWVISNRTAIPRVGGFIGVAVVVTVLVVGLDLGLGAAFGTGESTIAIALTGRAQDTIGEVRSFSEEPSNVRYRLAWWGQAASAVIQRPMGHGLGSFAHVVHAYQNAPMLWSASPHNIWLRVAVEGGLLAVVALAVLVVGGFVAAWRRGSVAAFALVAAAVVMSLDIFDVMPVQALVWWSAIGTAWGSAGDVKGRALIPAGLMMLALLVASLFYSIRLNSTCEVGCEPIVHYGGHPRFAGRPELVIGANPDDERWVRWEERYPFAFWLRRAHADSERDRDEGALLRLIAAYPYHAAYWYIDAAGDATEARVARDIASCGLQRFFDGSVIWRTSRISWAELEEQRLELQRIAAHNEGTEAACERLRIPPVPIGFQAR